MIYAFLAGSLYRNKLAPNLFRLTMIAVVVLGSIILVVLSCLAAKVLRQDNKRQLNDARRFRQFKNVLIEKA